MLRRFGLDGPADAVTHTNRFLRTEAYAAAVEGRLDADQFATARSRGPLGRLRAAVAPAPTDNACVTVRRMAGQYLALTETPRMVAFDPATLSTRGEVRFEDDVPGQVSLAHVQRDRDRGETVGLTTAIGLRSAYHLYRLPDGARRRRHLTRLPVDRPAYVHSVGLTDRHVVVVEPPFVLRPRRLLGTDGFVDAFRWRPERGTRFRVVDRDAGRVVADARAPPAFAFHVVNAFDDPGGEGDGAPRVDGDGGGEDAVVVDLVAFEDATVVSDLSLSAVEDGDLSGALGRPRRYRVPLSGAAPTVETLADVGVELPRTAPAARRRPYRYAYAQGAPRGDAVGVVRLDVRTGDRQVWRAPNCVAGEPVFVPGPTAGTGDAEADGVVLSVVLDATAERSFLLVLEADTFLERARAHLPHHLPLGFHGRFFGDVPPGG
jgi:carotenoid cleavage dioxygenase-like enzyme